MTRSIHWLWPGLVILIFVFVGCNSDSEVNLPPESSSFNSPPATIERETGETPAVPPVVAVISTPEADMELINQGRQLYLTHCAPCHQANGEGNLSTFPALNANPLVLTDNPAPAIDVVLHGRGVMPSFEGSLSAPQIAAILSYVRNAWNNEASSVSAEQVQAGQEAGSSDNEVAQEQ